MVTDSRRTTGGRWLPVLCAVSLVAVGAVVAVGIRRDDPGPAAAGGLTAQHLTDLFERYGDTAGRWNGADRTESVALPDGRLLWLFSDTFLGPVNPDGSRPRTSAFIHNSAIVQEGDGLHETVHGGTPDQPTSLVPADRADEFYWIGSAQVVGDGLQVLVNRYRRTGAGPLDHTLLGTALATLALPALTLTGLRPLPVGSRVSWGSALLRDGGYTYVYGTEAADRLKFAHLARVAADDLTGPWEFWTGSGWSSRETTSTRLFSGVGTAYGVQRVDDHYVLVSHENNVVFSPDVVAYTAQSPTGPFQGPHYLHRATENDAGHVIYDADLHPDLARPGRLLVSYNVNNLDDAVTYADASVYRPRFLEVAWPPGQPDRDRQPPTPAGLTAAARGAGNVELRWQRPREDGLTYRVYRRDVTAGQTHFVRYGRPVADPHVQVDLLVNGHEYEFQVTATDRRGESPASTTVRVTATAPPPPAPQDVRAVAGTTGEVTLRWAAVPFVQVFRVYQRDLTAGAARPALAGTFTGTTATLGPLRHGHRHEFTVVAVGGGGPSAPSQPVHATPFVAPPPAPQDLTVTAHDDGTARLTWTSLGPHVSYRVYRRDMTAGERALGRPTAPSLHTDHTAAHLEHGHEYEFAVRAVNLGGEGTFSAPVRVRAHIAAPDTAPTRLRAEPGPGRVELTWQSPDPDGWHQIYRRDRTAQEEEFTGDPVLVRGSRATLPLLESGHEYEFTVAVRNPGGVGPTSTPVRVTVR